MGFVPAQFILTVIANSGLRDGKDNSIMKKFNNTGLQIKTGQRTMSGQK